MKSLPVTVEDKDIDEMFTAANVSKDGRISYEEFQVREDKCDEEKFNRNPTDNGQTPGASQDRKT